MKTIDSHTVTKVTLAMLSAAKRTIKAALAYEKATGSRRKMGITGEIGEILTCHQLRLRLSLDPQSEGYDAVDSRGKRDQIKTRRSESGDIPRNVGRLSTFSQHPFDYALLVLLDQRYRLAQIWQAGYKDIRLLIEKQKRRNPSLSAFKRLAKCIYDRE